MTFTPEQTAELKAPLLRDHVAEREQAGRRFSYIEGWWAEAEANRIFGFDGWDTETLSERCVAENARKIGRAPSQRDGWAVSYVCKVRVTVTTPDGKQIVRDGVGAGHGIDADVGLAHESAIKEAATDAEKRALKTFGNPFGLALYDKTQANVADERPASSSSRLSAFEAKRQGIGEGIRVFIQSATGKQLSLWMAEFDHNTAHVPLAWLEGIRDLCEGRLVELNTPVPPEVEAGADEMDRQFRETVAA